MKRFIVILILNTLVTGLFAQINKFGTPDSKSYSMQVIPGAEQYNWSIVKDKFGAMYFGNDNNMVLRYDGTRWTSIPMNRNNPSDARSLGIDENGIIYVGGTNEFGYIEPDPNGKRVYKSLVDSLGPANDITSYITCDPSLEIGGKDSVMTIGTLQSIVIKDSKVYFMSERSIIIYDIQKDSLSYINLRKLGYRQFLRMFLIDNKIILASNILGLVEFDGNRLSQLTGGEFFKYKKSITVLPYADKKVIVGTLDKGIYILDYSTGAIDSSFVERKLFNRLKESQIYFALKLHSGEIALGTYGDGAYVINHDGSIAGHYTSSNTKMVDNLVSAMYSDPDNISELWISVTASISKIYLNLPYTYFSEKSGIDASVNSFCNFNGSAYVATDLGLYKSSTDENGERIFKKLDNISTQQIFNVDVVKFDNDSFLLAASNFDGVYQVFPNNKSLLLSVTRDPTRTIFQSGINKSRFYFGLTKGLILIVDYKSGKWHEYGKIKEINALTANYCEMKNGDLLILTSYPERVYKVPFNDTIPEQYTTDSGIPDGGLNNLTEYNGDFILATTRGLFKLNTQTDKWIPCDEITGGYSKNRSVDAFYESPSGNIWISTSEEKYYDIMFKKSNDSISMLKGGALSIIPSVKYMSISSVEGRDWFAKAKSIYVIDNSKISNMLPAVQTYLSKIVLSAHGDDSLIMDETFFRTADNGRRYPVGSNSSQKTPEFKYKFNSPSFYWTTPYMIEEEATLYCYKLEGFEDKWSNWENIRYKDFTNLPFGKYTFRVKAKTMTEIESQEASYSFNIMKPWYVTPWMIFLYAVAAVLSVIGIIMAYTKRLKNENIRLEGIVAERTAVVVKQKEELESSIHYASRIQMALLPSEAILSENIKNYFVLFKPRDIVSGDFYWMTKKSERLYIVAADCTGHGVPGAFMSLLGMSFLDEIIDKEAAPRADFILNQLRLHVTDSLKQVGGDDEAKDGMDMAILVIDFNSKRIEFSGAYNPCFKVRKLAEHEVAKYDDESVEKPDGSMSNGKYLLETIYASKMPIGISSRMNEDFVFYDWNLEKGISYYMFSDGYIDQFGGEHGRKFMKKNFKRLLLEIQDYPMTRQKELLEKNLKDWMGHCPQIDDILVMGIRTE
ncbi:MAG: triple tyrosine motif-containing protein [Bacteroidia bacterium]|nr:triple tyrosine motif-containing protein [Bacteroidia bacterium]